MDNTWKKIISDNKNNAVTTKTKMPGLMPVDQSTNIGKQLNKGDATIQPMPVKPIGKNNPKDYINTPPSFGKIRTPGIEVPPTRQTPPSPIKPSPIETGDRYWDERRGQWMPGKTGPGAMPRVGEPIEPVKVKAPYIDDGKTITKPPIKEEPKHRMDELISWKKINNKKVSFMDLDDPKVLDSIDWSKWGDGDPEGAKKELEKYNKKEKPVNAVPETPPTPVKKEEQKNIIPVPKSKPFVPGKDNKRYYAFNDRKALAKKLRTNFTNKNVA